MCFLKSSELEPCLRRGRMHVPPLVFSTYVFTGTFTLFNEGFPPPQKCVFFNILCGFLLRLAVFQTLLAKQIKSRSPLIQSQKYLDSVVVFFTLTMGLKQKKRWRSRSKPGGVWGGGLLSGNCSHFTSEQPFGPRCKRSLDVHKGVC